MRSLWALIKNNFKISIGHKPISFLIITLAPILILVIASNLITYSTSYVNVGIVDNDKTKSADAAIEIMKHVEGLNVYSMTEEEAQSGLEQNQINVVFKIDQGFEKEILNGELEGVSLEAVDGQNVYQLINSMMKNHLLNFRNLGRVTQGDEESYYQSISNYVKSSEKVNRVSLNDLYTEYNNSNAFIGFLIMFIFFKASSVANSINKDKERNVYSRIFLAKVKTWQYYGANIICNLAIVFFQLFVAVFAMQYIVHTSIGISVLPLLLILMIVSTVAVAFGTFCVAVISDNDTASMVSTLFGLLFVILGGSFIQVEYFPDLIKKISYISPIRWAMECVLNMQQGISLSEMIPELGVMGGMTVVLLTVAFIISKRKDKTFISI